MIKKIVKIIFNFLYTVIVSKVQKKRQNDAFHTYIRKAFNSVFNNILIHKLSNLGVTDPMLSWFRSYLMGKNKLKLIIPLKSSQGYLQVLSRIYPSLFKMYVN